MNSQAASKKSSHQPRKHHSAQTRRGRHTPHPDAPSTNALRHSLLHTAIAGWLPLTVGLCAAAMVLPAHARNPSGDGSGGGTTPSTLGCPVSSNTTLSGTFANSVFCKIVAGVQLTNGGALTNYSTGTLANYGILSNNAGATLSNWGKVINESGGTLSNAGSLTNQSLSTLTNNSTASNSGNLTSFGTVTNTTGATFNNSGNLITGGGGTTNNQTGATLNNLSGGFLAVRGVLNNAGSLTNQSGGTLQNYVTLNNSGYLSNFGALGNVGSMTNALIAKNYSALSNTGTLTNNSRFFNSAGGTLDNHSTLTNNQYFFNHGTLNNAGTLNNSYGWHWIWNYGTLNNTGTLNNDGFISDAGTVNNSGAINNTRSIGFNSLNNNSGGLVSNSYLMSVGTSLNNNSGATVNNRSSFSNYGIVTNAGTLTNQAGANLTNKSGATVNNTGLLHNEGAVDIRAYSQVSNQAGGRIENLATVTNSGTLINQSGAVLSNAGNLSNNTGYGSAGTFINNGTVDGVGTFTQVAGTSQINGSLTQSQVTIQSGKLSGTGTIAAPVINSGGVIMGGSPNTPGTLSITGSFSQNAGGTWQELFTGTGMGQYSLIDINGSVSLDGTLNILTDNGFTFAPGQTFTIADFTPGNLSGNFANMVFGSYSGNGTSLDIGNNLTIDAWYNNALGNIQLHVSQVSSVPLPGAVWLLGSGLLGLMGFSRIRKEDGVGEVT